MSDTPDVVQMAYDINRKARCGELPYEAGKVAREFLLMRSRIDRLFDAIAHGDEDHCAWLKKKLEEHFT